jgi:peroxiredoxin/outer membrane lipoprotein-sorting protein
MRFLECVAPATREGDGKKPSMRGSKHVRKQNARRDLSSVRGLLIAVAVLCLCALASPRVSFGDDEADQKAAMDILHKTAATYQKLQSYEFKVTIHIMQGSTVSEQCVTEGGARPGKYRIDDADPHGGLRVSDGQAEWVLSRESNTYTKGAPLAASVNPITDFENIDQHVAYTVIMREEKYIADGNPVMVYVVAVVRDHWPPGTLPGVQFMMYRIDEETFAVHAVTTHTPDRMHETETAVYSIVKWNEEVPDTEFMFTPPPSAREASSIPAPVVQVNSLIGTQAPDFTLQDTNGKTVSLHDFRGKVVIIDFWTTWCPPCRERMPQLQDLQQKLADKGLVVLGLDVGEDLQTVAQFAEQGPYTFALLLGGEPEVDTKYYVNAFPTTFVVNREGKIVYRDERVGPMRDLKSAVKNALK